MSLHDVYKACETLYEIRQRSELLFQVAFQLALICSLIGQPNTGLTGEVLCSPGGHTGTGVLQLYGPNFSYRSSSDTSLCKRKLFL